GYLVLGRGKVEYANREGGRRILLGQRSFLRLGSFRWIQLEFLLGLGRQRLRRSQVNGFVELRGFRRRLPAIFHFLRRRRRRGRRARRRRGRHRILRHRRRRGKRRKPRLRRRGGGGRNTRWLTRTGKASRRRARRRRFSALFQAAATRIDGKQQKKRQIPAN